MIEIRSDVTVELVRSNATDLGVVEAARVSTLGELADLPTEPEKQQGLINFLMRDRHGSPFEHNSMTFRVTAPIFVFREWHRHRAGWSYNEESGRYRELGSVFYIPDERRDLVQVGKPGAYTFQPGSQHQHLVMSQVMNHAYREAWRAYQAMLNAGIAREVARMVLPVGIFSTMYATCNARSLMHFLSLRTKDYRSTVPSFPQREIEMAAEKMEALWSTLMPKTHNAFCDYGRMAP
jgi:thymidylate synthase (FAD)